MFDLAALESALAGTIFAGKLHFSPITGSTNTDALLAARGGAPHGSVYFADEQQAGRGRGDHAWHSSAGEGLYVSVLLRPDIPAARLPLLPLAAGLAAAEAIRAASGLEVDLRWPNDLLSARAKQVAFWWRRTARVLRLRLRWWASESMCISAASIRRSARLLLHSISNPGCRIPRQAVARFPAKIAGARDRLRSPTRRRKRPFPRGLSMHPHGFAAGALKCMARRHAQA